MSQPQLGTLDFMARMRPDELAIVDGERRLSWRQWDDRASRLASYLRERLEVTAGDRIAWMLPNVAAYYDLWFAAQKLGVSTVSIPHRLTAREAAYIIDHSGAKVLVLDAELAPKLATVRDALPNLTEASFLLVGEGGASALPRAANLEHAIQEGCAEQSSSPPIVASAMVYTSGTTGTPKGAVRDLRGRDPTELRAYQRGMAGSLGFAPGADVHLVTCPLYHSAPPVFANLAQVMGGRVVLMAKFDAEQALALIERERVTSSFMVPTLLRRIVSLPDHVKQKYDLSSMQRLITGGAPCPFELKERVIATFPQPCLYEFYGSTETAVVTVIKPHEQLGKPGSCGRLVPGAEAKILDDTGQEVAGDQRGTLWVRHPMVIAGYHNNEEATLAALQDGFFCVGDVAKRDDDGFYYIVDRKNDMIISGGVNIYPVEVETEIRKHSAIYDCAVFGIPNEEWGEEVKAVVQLAPGARCSEAELKAFLETRLAVFKRPRSVDFMAELPYSPSGKLLKKELRAPYWADTHRSI
jgi:acyl-CoA synthetase (AMP-forming)/AMP-acid ligase II